MRVLQSGNVSYVFRYKFNKKSHKLFLGRFVMDSQGLTEARLKAREASNELIRARSNSAGIDPVTARKKNKEPDQSDLVKNVVVEFIELYAKPRQRDWKETQRILLKEIVSRWGNKSLSGLSSSEVRVAIRDIAVHAPVGANRILAHLKKLCSWAIDQEIITASPITGIKAPSSEKGRSRDRVLDDEELARVWHAAHKVGSPFGSIIQFLILTGQRRGEVAGMSWEEIDVEKQIWAIPARRSKNGRSHRLPLTKQCIDLLNTIPRYPREPGTTDFVFSSGTTPPSGFTKLKTRLDQTITVGGFSIEPYVIHDLRRSVATGMARLGVSLPVIERCLNHVSGSFGGIVGVYQRHSYAEETRLALQSWAAHIQKITRITDSETI